MRPYTVGRWTLQRIYKILSLPDRGGIRVAPAAAFELLQQVFFRDGEHVVADGVKVLARLCETIRIDLQARIVNENALTLDIIASQFESHLPRLQCLVVMLLSVLAVLFRVTG